MEVIEDQSYPCPSCGFLVFGEPPGSYDICPVGGWEDDHVQSKHPMMRGGANGGNLFEYQQQVLKEVPAEVREHEGYIRCRGWRPSGKADLESSVGAPETGMAYFHAAAEDSPAYYWERAREQKDSI